MEENKKINTQIVIMVVIVIILILSLLGILLYVVNENKGLINNTENNTTVTTSTTMTTTMPIIIDEKTIVENVMEEYLTLLKNEDKISDFQYEVSLLTEESYCSGMEYFPDKIYASVKVTYKRVDETFTLTGNDDNTNTGSEDVYEADATYIISQIDELYQVEDLYTGC